MNRGKEQGAQNFGQFCQWLCIVFVEGVFLCVKCRDFLHLCRCLVLHCFLETSSIYSSFIDAKEVRRLIIKVGSIKVCLLSCQVYYTYETCKHCALQQRKWLCISVLISLLKLIRNISKYHFSSEGVLLNSIMDINWRGRGTPKSDGCRCEGRGGQVFSHCGSHKWMPLKWKDYRNPCKNLKLLICGLYASKPSYL